MSSHLLNYAEVIAMTQEAAKDPDWIQVVFNQGPPCFHLEGSRFCLRAERWDGHRILGEGDVLIHEYVSLEDLLLATRANALRYAAALAKKHRPPATRIHAREAVREEVRAAIRDEERGERIAAEEISKMLNVEADKLQ